MVGKIFGKNKKETKEKKPCLTCQLKIAEANDRAVESEEKLLRAAADLENYKKRQQKEMDMYKKVTVQAILLDFLPVIDEINLAIEAASDGVKRGLKMTKTGLLKKLEKHGVTTIKALGAAFDPSCHEAVMVLEKEDHEENTVIAVIEDGYVLDGFLLRSAKVVVSKNLNRGESDEENF